MYIEVFILAALLLFGMNYTGKISANRFVADNEVYFRKLKESDWDFYVKARYGDQANSDFLFNNRIKKGLLAIVIMLCFFISNLTYVTVLFSILGGYLVFRMDYSSLKKYYKRHLTEIDSMLPHYLKSLEILIQHYTVPVALGKSIDDAPDIFKPGLRKLIDRINSGDSSIDPYMEFANTYPVRDSMRMMRLLYRLGLGSQERKQERLMMFSRTVSNLQNKARETKYKERLNHMESQTMVMLVVTGAGTMLVILISMMMMFNM